MKSSLFVFASLSTLMLISCKKHGAPDAGGTTLDKVIVTSPGLAADTTFYQYDSQNRLVSVTQAPISNGTSFFSFTYDPAGNLSGYTESSYATGNIMSYAFQYDNNGRIVKSIGTPLMANLEVPDYVYTWDGQGRLIADTQLVQKTVAFYSTFTYDAHNNMMETSQFEMTAGSVQKIATNTNTYNNSANPYFAIGIPLFMIYNEGSLLCASNADVRQYTFENNPAGSYAITASYSYYSNGLVRQQVMGKSTTITNPSTFLYYFKAP
jgi:YD repeat-containing protein